MPNVTAMTAAQNVYGAVRSGTSERSKSRNLSPSAPRVKTVPSPPSMLKTTVSSAARPPSTKTASSIASVQMTVAMPPSSVQAIATTLTPPIASVSGAMPSRARGGGERLAEHRHQHQAGEVHPGGLAQHAEQREHQRGDPAGLGRPAGSP